MYLEHHGLKLLPFENTPDPRFFFPVGAHRESLAIIEYMVAMRKGVVVISGPIGSGKTTISHTVVTRISGAEILLLRQAPRTGAQFLKLVARRLGIELNGSPDRCDLITSIETELMRRHQRNQAVVLLVDEAQMVSAEVLDEIRLLSNIELPNAKLVQIVLIGQEELDGVLSTQRMAPLRQRVVLWHHIEPLSRDETAQYLRHRLTVASAPDPCRVRFSEGAINQLFEHSRGCPRLINMLADHALLMASLRSTHIIDSQLVATLLYELALNRPTMSTPSTPLSIAA